MEEEYVLNGKVTIVLVTSESIKKTWYKWLNVLENRNLYYDLKVDLDVPNYETKRCLKNATGADKAEKTDLANFKSDVDKLDTDKLKNVPSKFVLSNLKSKVDQLTFDKLVLALADLSKVMW